MAFPSTFSTFTRPAASDRLNNPSHSALHNTVSSALGQVEAVIGTDSSTIGTIIGDLRNPASDGGGHVQSAVKGGTGQTTFAKGDILVAQSASVLSKLAVGTDSQSLVADSSVASGIRWGTPGGTKIAANASVITILNNAAETSVISATVPGSTLGTSNVVRTSLYVNEFASDGNAGTLTIRGIYAGNVVASVVLAPSGTTFSSMFGKIEFTMVGNGATNAQRGNLLVDFAKNAIVPPTQTSIAVVRSFSTGTSSVESSGNQSFGVTAKWGSAAVNNKFEVNQSFIEKII